MPFSSSPQPVPHNIFPHRSLQQLFSTGKLSVICDRFILFSSSSFIFTESFVKPLHTYAVFNVIPSLLVHTPFTCLLPVALLSFNTQVFSLNSRYLLSFCHAHVLCHLSSLGCNLLVLRLGVLSFSICYQRISVYISITLYLFIRLLAFLVHFLLSFCSCSSVFLFFFCIILVFLNFFPVYVLCNILYFIRLFVYLSVYPSVCLSACLSRFQ